MPGRGRPFRPGQSGNPGGARAFPHKTWPLAREILHRAIRTNQATFEQTLGEPMLTKKGALQVLELLAKLNREIGSRYEAPAVRIVIGGNIPLEGMRAGTPPALPEATDPDANPRPVSNCPRPGGWAPAVSPIGTAIGLSGTVAALLPELTDRPHQLMPLSESCLYYYKSDTYQVAAFFLTLHGDRRQPVHRIKASRRSTSCPSSRCARWRPSASRSSTAAAPLVG
jgi:hypothetical protein